MSCFLHSSAIRRSEANKVKKRSLNQMYIYNFLREVSNHGKERLQKKYNGTFVTLRLNRKQAGKQAGRKTGRQASRQREGIRSEPYPGGAC